MKPKRKPSHPTLDIRTFPGEVRMTTLPSGRKKIEGYAAVYDSRSAVIPPDKGGPFVEIVRPGAFDKSLADGTDVCALFNHDKRFILGRRSAGTLRIASDSRGLPYEIDLGTRSYDRDLEESMERGDVVGSSFSFVGVEDNWFDDATGMVVRELRCVHLFDVGPCVFPAYRGAIATCRSLEIHVESRSARCKHAETYPNLDQRMFLDWLLTCDL